MDISRVLDVEFNIWYMHPTEIQRMALECKKGMFLFFSVFWFFFLLSVFVSSVNRVSKRAWPAPYLCTRDAVTTLPVRVCSVGVSWCCSCVVVSLCGRSPPSSQTAACRRLEPDGAATVNNKPPSLWIRNWGWYCPRRCGWWSASPASENSFYSFRRDETLRLLFPSLAAIGHRGVGATVWIV